MLSAPYRTYVIDLVPSVGTLTRTEFHAPGDKIGYVSIRQLTFGAVLNIHLPTTADPIPVREGEAIEVNDDGFAQGLAYSCPSAPVGAQVVITVFFKE